MTKFSRNYLLEFNDENNSFLQQYHADDKGFIAYNYVFKHFEDVGVEIMKQKIKAHGLHIFLTFLTKSPNSNCTKTYPSKTYFRYDIL